SLLNQGRANDAIAAFQQALRSSPNSLEAKLGLAQAYQKAGKDAEAWAAYQRVLEQDPNNIPALRAVGLLGSYRAEWQARGIDALMTLLNQNPNDKEAHKMFQQINEANEVLSNPEMRRKYDQYGAQYGKNWKRAEEFEKAYHGTGSDTRSWGDYTYSGGQGEGDFSDFFESLFGRGGRNCRTKAKFKGEDYHAELHLNLSEAAQTHQRILNVNGKSIRITIPAGVENGQVIKLKGHGEEGLNGGPNGDLYITFVIQNDTRFKRAGNDLYTNVELSLYTAVLGGEVTVDTLNGKVKLKVAPETQNGTKIRLKGKGFPVYKQEGQHGDLYITYEIKIPTHLTERQKELFRELAKTSS
ncbi:MAG: tetratricopeptide repeat protein, partial [Microcoleus sp. C1-bin4]|nr:tetratricopeptide repeat protein [Microcoleus sp. C1-bin4]